MNVARYTTVSPIRHFHDEVNRLFNADVAAAAQAGPAPVAQGAWRPAVDIREEAQRFVIAADVPGVDPADIEITMEDGVLSIKGERKAEDADGEAAFKRAERSRGGFERRFSLPDTADSGAVSARSSHGVLEVSIPKKQTVQPRRIEVQ